MVGQTFSSEKGNDLDLGILDFYRLLVSITLFTTYYETGAIDRQNELRECLINNLRNPSFKKIILLLDPRTSESIVQEFQVNKNFEKISLQKVTGKPTYKDWISLSEKLGINGISLFANADIYFDSTVESLAHYLEKAKSFVCISRKEDLGDSKVLHKEPYWSQDAWAINSKSLSDLYFLDELAFETGKPRCDNKVAFHFAIHGWDIYNPCYDINVFHKHCSNHRNYKVKTRLNLGGIAMVHPTLSPVQPSLIDIEVMILKQQNFGSVRLNDWLGEPENRVVAPTGSANEKCLSDAKERKLKKLIRRIIQISSRAIS
jgi:hypothetical protein